MIQRCVGKTHEAMVESERTGTSRLGENVRTMLHMYCDNHIQRPRECSITYCAAALSREEIIYEPLEGSPEKNLCETKTSWAIAYKNRMQPNE